MKFNKRIGQILWVILIAAVTLGAPRLGGLVANLFDFSAIDPDGAFAWISVHHIVQALVILLIMAVISRQKDIRFGFGWGDRKVGLLYVRLFTIIFSVYALVSTVIIFLIGRFSVFPYPLTVRNIVGQMGFQLLLSGPSEELIFRAFAITMLALFVQGPRLGGEQGIGKVSNKVFGGALTMPNLIAAVIFGLAHVGITLAPLSFSYNTFQLIYAVFLGLFYGVCYERSKSMIYPMIMHSLTNVVAVGITILASFLLQ
jgi:uncharacterized protein